MNRREFIRTAGGATAAVTAASAASGTAFAQEDGGEGDEGGDGENGGGEGGGGNQQPDFGGHIDGVDGGYEDLRGQEEATVTVGASGNGGNLAFEPAGIWVDEGTTVTWEWTGEGGGHNVAVTEGDHDFSSEVTEEAGFTFEHTFEGGGISQYVCEPHESLDMKGAVGVGEDIETVEAGGAGGGGAWPEDVHDIGVPLQAHWVGSATILGIFVTLVFTFYVLKYGESPNTGTGRR